jgi:hypothetical protein
MKFLQIPLWQWMHVLVFSASVLPHVGRNLAMGRHAPYCKMSGKDSYAWKFCDEIFCLRCYNALWSIKSSATFVLLVSCFDLEDGVDIFLQSVVSSKGLPVVASHKTELRDSYEVQEGNFNLVAARRLDQ